MNKSFSHNDFSELEFSDQTIYYLCFAFLLMPINWLIEATKWQFLLNKIHPQSFAKTIRDVLSGVSTSLITPNRIGNFIGRTVNLPKEVKTKAIIATIHSNLAQFISSIAFGLIGLALFKFNEDFVQVSTVSWSAFFVLSVGLFFYYFPKVLDVNPIAKLFSEQSRKAITYLQDLKFGFKTIILLLSMLRYSVFLAQFYLLLSCFNADLSFEMIIPAIAVVFLITTIIPSFLFGKLFVREASALFVLTECGVPTPVILFTVFVLWTINLALPSLVGGVILMKSK